METKPQAICVLGMHRSGTSVIARAINLLGIFLGDTADLMAPADNNNPYGFWELNEIVALHDRILDQFNRKWDTIIPLPDRWHALDDIEPFKETLFNLIEKNFSGHRLWAWKDPRSSILIPMWKDVLNQLGIELSIVLVVRNPLDIAKSLMKRDNFPYNKSFGIWFHYTISALLSVVNLPSIFVHYDEVLEDWESELRRCAVALGIAWPKDDSLLKYKMNEFIRPNLRHSYSGIDALKRADVPGPVKRLYELLLIRASEVSPSDEAFSSKISELSHEFSSYARLFLHERDRELDERDRKLRERDAHIQALLNSWSWRITKPLRALHKRLR